MSLTPDDIEAIERATLQAVAPEELHALPGWLLPMDRGTVGRARSAVPLHHGTHDPAMIDAVLERYAQRKHTPAFRLPDTPTFAALHPALSAHGFVRQQATLTQVGSVQRLSERLSGPLGEVADTPSPEWLAMFLGEGLDPVDGASRARSLARAKGTRFVSVRLEDRVVASGAVSFGQCWMGVHGMRTAAAHRGKGLAAGVLLTMAQEARRRGIERVFLQVLADNAPALALYRRAGLSTAWPYAYWQPAAAPGV